MQVAEGLRRNGCEVSFVGSDPVLCAMMRKSGFVSRRILGPKPPVTKKTVMVFPFLMILFVVRMLLVLVRSRLHGVRTVYCLSLPDKFLTPVFRLLGMRVVWVEHARIGKWLTRNPYLPFYWLFAWLTKGVVFTSALARAQARWIPHGVVIPCGIAVGEFKDAGVYELDGVAKDALAIGVIARFSVDKGVAVFLEAAALVSQKDPAAVFVCCGDGPEENVIRDLAGSLEISKRVIFLKNLSREDLGRLYKRLSIVVLPSTAFDPFGLVPGEAMALGKPVVVTDVCGIAGYMHNGVDGMVVKAGDVEELAGALVWLMQDQNAARTIAAAGQRLITKELNVEKLVRGFERLFFENS